MKLIVEANYFNEHQRYIKSQIDKIENTSEKKQSLLAWQTVNQLQDRKSHWQTVNQLQDKKDQQRLK